MESSGTPMITADAEAAASAWERKGSPGRNRSTRALEPERPEAATTRCPLSASSTPGAVATLPTPTIALSGVSRGSIDEVISAMFRSSRLRTTPSIDQRCTFELTAAGTGWWPLVGTHTSTTVPPAGSLRTRDRNRRDDEDARIGLFRGCVERRGERPNACESHGPEPERLHLPPARKGRVGLQLEERDQHEPPLMHAWMGHLEVRLVDLSSAEREDVEVDDPRPPSLPPHPPKGPLRLQAGPQQVPGRASRLHLDHGVQVVGLRGSPHGLGLVHAGGSEDAYPSIVEEVHRSSEIVQPVAEVRADPHEGPVQGYRSCSRAVASAETSSIRIRSAAAGLCTTARHDSTPGTAATRRATLTAMVSTST